MNKKLNIPKPLHEYAILTFASFLMGFGIYFFRFPNNFSFGGVTGIAVIMAKAVPLSASTITFILNILLLILGVVVLGKSFGIKTAYTTIMLSISMSLFEFLFPMSESAD